MGKAHEPFLEKLASLIDEAAIEAVEKKSDELRSVVVSKNLLSDQLASLISNIDFLNSELAVCSEKYLALENVHKESVSELHVAKSEETRLSQELFDLRASTDSIELDLRAKLASKVAELQDVTSDRDAIWSEKCVFQKTAEELMQQVTAKEVELEAERNGRAAEAECVEALKGELADVKSERDARAQEKGEAQQEVEVLKQQVATKEIQLEAERNERAAEAKRMKALEGELAVVKGERDARAKEKEEAMEEAELTLLQLHQVQEELERYFLESRAQEGLLRQHQTQSLAMRQALAKLVVSQA